MKFDSYHPFINLIYFVASIAFIVSINHPVYVLIAYICMFIYSIKVNGPKQLILNFLLAILTVAYVWYYSFYTHFGITAISTNFIGNNITIESILFGAIRALKIAALVMNLSCLVSIFSTDKIIFLFGRVSPKLSLFISIIVRAVPRFINQFKKINISRCEIGKGIGQGNLLRRFLNFCSVLSIAITWALENFIESAASMKCRGYSLKGRTAYSIYRFDNRDRGVVFSFSLFLIAMFSAISLKQTYFIFNPYIETTAITGISYFFYAIYFIFLLIPFVLQIYAEHKFSRIS